MSPVELSICLTRIQTTQDIDHLLEPFNAKRSADNQAKVRVIVWDNYKTELTSMALYGRGSDISQVGAPLMSDLLAMNALRPFKEIEITSLGGAEAFNPIAWQSSRRVFEKQVWAIPWLADPRAVIYWRDMLEKAGVSTETAFTSFENMQETLQRLQASGVETPLVLPNDVKLATLQTACTWIWGYGGDFVTPDQKVVAVNQPAAIDGLQAYYSLYRFLPKDKLMDFGATNDYFTNRQAAITLGNLGPGTTLLQNTPPELRSQLAVAMPPGPPYVGGSSLIIWRYTRHEQAALDVVRYLTSPEAQVEYAQKIGYLPVRNDALTRPPYSTDYMFRSFALALEKGRIFPNIKLSGLLEDRLSTVLDQVWRNVYANPKLDLQTDLHQWIDPLVRRFELWAG